MRRRELMRGVSMVSTLGASIRVVSRYQHECSQSTEGLEVRPLRMCNDRVGGLRRGKRTGIRRRDIRAARSTHRTANAGAETNSDTCPKARASTRAETNSDTCPKTGPGAETNSDTCSKASSGACAETKSDTRPKTCASTQSGTHADARATSSSAASRRRGMELGPTEFRIRRQRQI
jgi:hypothetical protein